MSGPRLLTAALVVDLAEALDPSHDGECWPDPIAWDGRSLDEQAEDLLVLAEDAEGRDPAERTESEIRVVEAALAVSEAMLDEYV